MKQIILAAALTFFQNFAIAQECTLPVCDIPKALEDLKNMNQSDRANTLKQLRVTYRGYTDYVVFQNLKEYADQAKDLFTELHEEDWVIREAVYLKDTARAGLIKFAPIDEKTMIQNFNELSDVQSSFDTLNHWALNVVKLEDPAQVLQVAHFAENAKEWSIRTQQEPYVLREAEKILTLASQLISHLYPSHEGVFEIQLTCESRRVEECGKHNLDLDRMTVFDTLGSRGLVVSLSDSKVGEAYFIHINSELTNNATSIYGRAKESNNYAKVSEIHLFIDPATGDVKGRFRDMMYPGWMSIKGHALKRPLQFYTDAGAPRVLKLADILGRYKGKLASIEGELVIERYETGEIVGTFSDGQGLNVYFRMGEVNVTRGVAYLSTPGHGLTADRKLVLGLRKKGQKEVLLGFMLTNAGRLAAAEFVRIGDR